MVPWTGGWASRGSLLALLDAPPLLLSVAGELDLNLMYPFFEQFREPNLMGLWYSDRCESDLPSLPLSLGRWASGTWLLFLPE